MGTKSETTKSGLLSGKTIAFIATDGVEQSELLDPRKIFDEQGAKTVLISLKSGKIQGFKHQDKGEQIPVDLTIDAAKADQFDALVLPGGVGNPDALRVNESVVAFVKAFVAAKKPIAAICHGPWTLIEANAVRGQELTSWPSLKTDLANAGARWVDKEVVLSGNLVTSRKPDDIPAFAKAMSELIAGQGKDQTQSPSGAKIENEDFAGVRLA
ncbi:MAG: type 1 glutamine amidotransferase domain-containing protein [Polyangiaceae bacterium]